VFLLWYALFSGSDQIYGRGGAITSGEKHRRSEWPMAIAKTISEWWNMSSKDAATVDHSIFLKHRVHALILNENLRHSYQYFQL
jgi:hypothetical protein